MWQIAVAGSICLCVLLPVPPPQASSLIEHDSTVAMQQPGPHDGGGTTTAYSFFARVPDLQLVFRKRALHRGAAIGYHRQDVDEIYYILSGTGELTLNGQRSIVGPGTAILTRPGSSHGLRQVGADDLVLIITYQESR
jgi:quercetin dioxygenase-like cupin family protein